MVNFLLSEGDCLRSLSSRMLLKNHVTLSLFMSERFVAIMFDACHERSLFCGHPILL